MVRAIIRPTRRNPSSAHVTCQTPGWRRCTLDGVIEAAGRSGRPSTPAHSRRARRCSSAICPSSSTTWPLPERTGRLSVICGTTNSNHEMAADWLYQLELLEAEEQFWDCVVRGAKPVPASHRRRRGQSGRARSASKATMPGPSRRIRVAAAPRRGQGPRGIRTLIKSLVEEDVGRAFGHGIEAKRSKSGAITIREFVR